jgi:NDP-sugar pyrophosphorylase family protein
VFSVILAAGSGVRMRPLSYYIPKILLPVRGRPVLDHLLRNLEGVEIDQHYVVASEYLEVIDRYIEAAGIERVQTVRGLGWETGGDLALALEQIGRDDDAFVMNGDIITDLNMAKLLEFHRRANGLATVSAFPLANEVEARRFGRIALDPDARIRSFEEKGMVNPGPESLVNSGFYVFDHRLVSQRSRYLVPRKFRLETELFPRLAKEGALFGYQAEVKYWWDVGTLESYFEAEEYLANQKIVIPPT